MGAFIGLMREARTLWNFRRTVNPQGKASESLRGFSEMARKNPGPTHQKALDIPKSRKGLKWTQRRVSNETGTPVVF
jgi:hypothetical protein